MLLGGYQIIDCSHVTFKTDDTIVFDSPVERYKTRLLNQLQAGFRTKKPVAYQEIAIEGVTNGRTWKYGWHEKQGNNYYYYVWADAGLLEIKWTGTGADLAIDWQKDFEEEDARQIFYSKTEADARFVNVDGDTMTGELSMTDNKITDLADATADTDALNRQSADARFVNVDGDTMTGNLAMSNNKVTGLATPGANTDAANKLYVDNRIAALGTLLTYKGTKPDVASLPATGNKVGDVWYVVAKQSAYAWVKDDADPTGRWEEFGPPINLEPYLKKADLATGTGQATDTAMTQKATTDAIGTVSGDVTALAGRVTTAEGAITTLQGRVGGIESDITTLEGRMDNAEGTITSQGEAIQNLVDGTTPVPGVDGAVMKAGLLQTTGQVTDNAMSQKAVTQAVGGVQGNLDNLASRVTAAEGSITNIINGTTPVPGTASDPDKRNIIATPAREMIYTATPTNPNASRIMADPTAPQARPIEQGQVAVYSLANQSYRPDDVQGTLLVADALSDMEAVNKRYMVNHTMPKNPTAPIDMYDQRIINLANPTSAKDAATKEYVDNAIQQGGGGVFNFGDGTHTVIDKAYTGSQQNDPQQVLVRSWASFKLQPGAYNVTFTVNNQSTQYGLSATLGFWWMPFSTNEATGQYVDYDWIVPVAEDVMTVMRKQQMHIGGMAPALETKNAIKYVGLVINFNAAPGTVTKTACISIRGPVVVRPVLIINRQSSDIFVAVTGLTHIKITY